MDEHVRHHDDSFRFQFSGNLEDFRVFCAILRGEDPAALDKAMKHLERSVQRVEHLGTTPPPST